MRLEVDTLAFGYPGRTIGREVSFSLRGGEVLAILRPNGGGKTTLFKTILRLLEPHAGRITVDGEPIEACSRRRLAQIFGYVPQAQLGLFPFTVGEMVLMGRTAHLGAFAAPSARDRAIAADAVETLGLAELAERPYTRVSGGERQLTLIARALAQEPALLVMDEPTASLDFGNQVRVLSQTRALAARGIGIILSTHDPDQAFLCADRVALLRGGTVTHVGPPELVITPASLYETYGVRVEVHEMVLDDGRGARLCVPSLAPRRPARNS